jgi:DNA invertase Pin-like site-specific DNA recombinase
MRAAIYARVSTSDQDREMQLGDLRRMAEARGFEVVEEYVDRAISGANDRRPALDRLMADARRERPRRSWFGASTGSPEA